MNRRLNMCGYGADGLAGTAIDGIFNAPCEPSVLFPRSCGNIHSFTALTPCAILDVLSPPYSDDLGRPSTYFLDFPIPSLPGKSSDSICTIISLLDIIHCIRVYVSIFFRLCLAWGKRSKTAMWIGCWGGTLPWSSTWCYRWWSLLSGPTRMLNLCIFVTFLFSIVKEVYMYNIPLHLIMGEPI